MKSPLDGGLRDALTTLAGAIFVTTLCIIKVVGNPVEHQTSFPLIISAFLAGILWGCAGLLLHNALRR